MSQLSLKDMLMEMAEKLYDDEECKNVDEMRKLISRAHGLIAISKTVNEITRTKIELVKMQVDYQVKLDESETGFKKISTQKEKTLSNNYLFRE